jgi:hypothetical protein
MVELRCGVAQWMSKECDAPSSPSDRNAPDGYLKTTAGNANAGSGNAITTARSSMSGYGYAKAGT